MDSIAWKKALILRGCPPLSVVQGKVDNNLRAHLDVCAACRSHLAMDAEEREGWAAMGHVLRPAPQPIPLRKAPGQIWRIRSELAGWGPKYRYCNPPLVLILENLDHGLARVAQIYPGDDFLTEDDIRLAGLGFVQSWNIYSLDLNDLELFRSEAPEIVPAVMERSRRPFPDLDEASPLFWFRTMELELGAFFAGQSLARLLDAPESVSHEQRPVVLSAMTSEDLRQALEQKGQKATLANDNPLLELARFARNDPAYGLAASPGQSLSVNYAVLDPVGLEIRQASITFSAVQFDDGVLVIGGKIQAGVPDTDEIFAWWDAELKILNAETMILSEDKLFFNLRFVGLSDRDFHVGRLVVLLSGHE